jgi:phosphoglycolate phosphatase-like HAD superfamily hydrolase
MASFPLQVDTVVLDVDGTLVDSNYHHTLAWWQSFHEQGRQVPAWRIHRSIGMGGDRLVAAVAGDEAEREVGDAVREGWQHRFDEHLDDIVPLPGAQALLADLDVRGFRVALASSGIPRHTAHAQEVLEAAGRVGTTTTSEDAEESKPAPELLEVALDRIDATHAVLVGDSVWDVRSATNAGLPVIALLCGGFGRAELEDEGAAIVLEDLEELRDQLDELVVRANARDPRKRIS